MSWVTPTSNAKIDLEALLKTHGYSGTGLNSETLKKFKAALANRNANAKREATASASAASASAPKAETPEETMARIAANFKNLNSKRAAKVAAIRGQIEELKSELARLKAKKNAHEMLGHPDEVRSATSAMIAAAETLKELEATLDNRRRGGRSFKRKRSRRRITRRQK